jgi:predicted component of type VI protein secretion system
MKLLFERLAGSDTDFDLERAVLDNVQRLVRTRVAVTGGEVSPGDPEASSPAMDAFDVLNCGVRSTVDLGSGDRRAIERYGARMQALISHYEPRLQTLGVELEGPNRSRPARLIVSGCIETPQGLQAMRFPVHPRKDG